MKCHQSSHLCILLPSKPFVNASNALDIVGAAGHRLAALVARSPALQEFCSLWRQTNWELHHRRVSSEIRHLGATTTCYY